MEGYINAGHQLGDMRAQSELVRELVALLQEAEAPVLLDAASSTDVERSLTAVIGKTRISTARGYMRRGQVFGEWLLMVHSAHLAPYTIYMLDYLQGLEDQHVGLRYRWWCRKRGDGCTEVLDTTARDGCGKHRLLCNRSRRGECRWPERAVLSAKLCDLV